MGGTCSSRRRNDSFVGTEDNLISMHRTDVFCRHEIDAELPDESIAGLFSVKDNYELHSDGKHRSPKSLVDLCTECVCRHIVHFDTILPSHLPKELTDQILQALVKHSALTSSTLRSLRQCEISDLILSKSRGVSDGWLSLFSPKLVANHDADVGCYASSSEESFHSTNSNGNECKVRHQFEQRNISTSKSSQLELPEISTADINMYLMCSDPKFSQNVEIFSAAEQIRTLDLRGSHKVTDRGLLQLNSLYSLEVVRLDQCYSLIGNGFSVFSNSHNLHTFTASNCRCLTDDAILHISNVESLKTLSLDGCRCLTDISVIAIGSLLNLKQLDLSQLDLVTNEGLKALNELIFLEELSLGWCRSIDDDGVQILCSQPGRSDRLKSLSLSRCHITDKGIEYLASLRCLRKLDLSGCILITSESLGLTLSHLMCLECLDVSYCPGILRSSWQNKTNNLRSLDVSYSDVKDVHLSRLTYMPSLEELTLDSTEISDWPLVYFAENNVTPNLKLLDLADNDISDLGLASLKKFKNLQHLSLFNCNISNDGLKALSDICGLETLNLDSRDITDEGLSHLKKLQNLKHLDIFSGRVTDNGCDFIGNITSLETLELCSGGISDLGCIHLARLVNLVGLNLSQNEFITNTGVSFFVTLTKLKYINLSYTDVDGSCLIYLKNLKQLQSIALYGCKDVGNHHVYFLQTQLPNLKCLRFGSGGSVEGTINTTFDDDDDQAEEDMIEIDGNEDLDTDAEEMLVN